MKRFILLAVVLMLVFSMTVNVVAGDKTDYFGLSASGGALFPVVGDYITAGTEFKDVVKTGGNIRFAVNYWINSFFAMEAAFNMNYMYFEDEFGAGLGPNAVWFMPNYTLNGILSFGHFISPHSRISPFVTFGVGIYPWKVNDDGLWVADIVQSPYDIREDFNATDFGWNAGAGIEYSISPRLSIFGQGKYVNILTADEDKFGPFFDNQGFATFDIGLTYYLPPPR